MAGINVTAPIAGENWSGEQQITWGADCANISNVNIYYSTDGFVTSSVKINNEGSILCTTNTYSWDTTAVSDENIYQIRVRDALDPYVYDTSGVFIIDNTDPSVDASALTSPNGGEFWAGGSTQTITWDANDIIDPNLKTNPISLYYTVDDGSNWVLVASGLENSGTYSWAVPDNTDSSTVKVRITATDLAGNTASDESNADFTIDSIDPAATVTITVNPIKMDALTQTVKVIYDESMDNTTVPVIAISGSNWGIQATGAWTKTTHTNDTYTTTLTHDGDAEEIADAVAVVATVSGATDLAGNSDIGDSSDVFVIDTKAPTVTTNGATASLDPAKAGEVTITVAFDENMDAAVFPTVQITGLSSSYTVTQSSYTNNTWTGTFTLADNEGEKTAIISVTGAKDVAGNVMATNANAGTFTVDTVNPTVSSITTSTGLITDAIVGSETFTVTIDYNEAMDITSSPIITFNPEVASITPIPIITLLGVSWSNSNKTYTATYNVADAGVEVAGVDITVGGAIDVAGNTQESKTTIDLFDIDTKNPTVILTDDQTDNIVKNGETVKITATFSEIMVSAPTIAIDTNGTDLSATAMSGSDKVWTYDYVVPTGSDGLVTIIISGTDIAGNPNDSATGITSYVIDNTAPEITVVLDDGDGYVNLAEATSGINIVVTTTGVEDGQTVSCEIKDSASTPNVISSSAGTINSNAVTFTSVVLTSLTDGTITATCDVLDVAGNPASSVSNTSIKDTSNPIAPTTIIYTSAGGIVVADYVNTTNTNFTGEATIIAGEATGGYAELLISGVSFTNPIKDTSIVAEEVAVAFNAGLSSNSTVQAQIAAGTQTLSVKLCDVAGNCTTSANTKSITADYTVPTIDSVALGSDEYVNLAEAGSGININITTTGVEGSQVVSCVITDTDSGTNNVGPLIGTISSNTVTISSGALTSLIDGTITATCDVSDVAGNPATQGSDDSMKDVVSPEGSATSPVYSTSLTFDVDYTASDANDIKHVELYYTTDDGTSWEKYGTSYSSSLISFIALADGTYGFYLVATDNAGNSEAVPVDGTTLDDSTVVDTGDPTATVGISQNPITDSNPSQTITVTYNEAMNPNTNPIITIVGLQSSYNATGGSWSKKTYDNDTYTATQAITDDNEEKTATVNVSGAEDSAGNTQVANNSTTFVVDTENPTVVSVTPTNLADTNVGTVDVIITFSEVMDSTNPTVTITGLTITPYTVASSSWSADKKEWKGTFTFNDNDEVGTGIYNISGAKDVVGNEMESDSTNTVAVDTKNPTATVEVGTAIISDSDLVQEVTVIYDEEMSVTSAPSITFSGGTWTPNSDGSWDTTTKWTQSFEIIDSGEEITGVTVTSSGVEDLTGNVEGANTTAPTFIVDTKNPTNPDASKMQVGMNTPPAVDTISGSEAAVKGGATVKVYSDSSLTTQIGSDVTADSNGIFGPINIGDNLYATVYVTATDAAGNESGSTAMVNDIAAPDAPTDLVLTDPINDGNQTTVTITGTGEVDAVINWTIIDKDSTSITGTGAVDSSNISITNIDVSTLADGTLTLTLTLTDSVGNVSEAGTDTATKDVLAPSVEITFPLVGIKVNGNAVITFTGSESATPQCSVDNTNWIDCVSGTTKLSNIAEFSGLGDTFTLYLTDTDTAGNIGADKEEGIIKDTVLPTITNITSDTANGSYTVGKNIDIDITFSENVISTGDITVTLDTSGTCVIPEITTAVNTATCNYTVAVGENTADLDATVSGTIVDEAGNAMTDFTPGTTLATNKDIVIDTEAPVIAPHDNITEEATSASGAVVTYTDPTATDNLGGTITVSCSPTSGSTFSLGATTVECSVTDDAGNEATSNFTITVKDTTAPSITVHSNIDNIEATSVDGVVVDYTNPTATDLVDGNVEVFCEPASGSTFGLGVNTVECSATDIRENNATSSFTVTVVDTTAPVIVSLTPGNTDTTSDTTPTISADFSENGSGVNVSNIVFSFSGNKEYADEYAVKSADGVVYEQVAPLIAGTYEAAVTAVDNAGNSATKTWSFIVNPTVTTIAVSSDEWSTYADGVSEIKITAEVRDEMGNPIISGTVNFVASPIGDLSDSISSLDENGLATTILTSSEVGNSTVTAYYDAPSGPINGSTYIYFNETPKAISVTATPDNVPANGSTESIITATISDNGDSIVGGTVNFTTDLGTLSFDNAISDVNGQAAVTLTSTTNSSATVTVSYNTGSGTINDQTNVEFTEYDNTPPTATQYPVDNLTNVAITINPYIDFSEAMNESSLNNNVKLKTHVGSNVVDASYSITTNGNGTTRVTIIPDEDLVYETQYYFYIDNNVEDLAGNKFAGDTWSSDQKDAHEFTTVAEDVPVTSYDISLNAGWNLISLPLIPDDSDIEVVLAGVTDIANVYTVKYYNSSVDSGTWSSYEPDHGGDLTAIEDGKGYWIYMNNADVLTVNGTETVEGGGNPTSYKLVEGDWNLVGFKSTTEIIASDYIKDYTDKTLNENSILWDYKDRDGDGDGEYSESPFYKDGIMEPGYGYWLLIQ